MKTGFFVQALFTRRKDLTNNIRLLIGTNGLHAILNGSWGTITHLANKYRVSRTFIYSLANNLKKAGQFLFEEATATTPVSLHREPEIVNVVVASTVNTYATFLI